jgi:hypothetical protein
MVTVSTFNIFQFFTLLKQEELAILDHLVCVLYRQVQGVGCFDRGGGRQMTG